MDMTEHDYDRGKGGQFQAAMDLEANPFNIAFGFGKGVVCMLQRDNFILFDSPEMMRQIAEGCVKVADMWERGELDGKAE
jgi:hypothetical protein